MKVNWGNSMFSLSRNAAREDLQIKNGTGRTTLLPITFTIIFGSLQKKPARFQLTKELLQENIMRLSL